MFDDGRAAKFTRECSFGLSQHLGNLRLILRVVNIMQNDKTQDQFREVLEDCIGDDQLHDCLPF
jgi:hypothetical protein